VPTALITCRQLQGGFERLRPEYEALGVTPILPALDGQRLDSVAMASLVDGVDAVIAGDDEIDSSVLRAGAASRLRAVIKWGVGTDAIDTATAAELGVPVFNTPGAFADEVADLALSHLLLLVRRTHRLHAAVVDGEWPVAEGRSLAGLVAGVIGLGSVGSAIAKRARACGVEVLGHDIRQPAGDDGLAGVRRVDLADLYAASDVVILACALTADNRHLVSRAAFAAMRDGVLVINVARGALIEEAALVEALAAGKVAGAGLDVFEHEPLPAADPLRAFADRCVFTTHSGSSTAEAIERTNRIATEILFDVLGLRAAGPLVPNRVA